MKVLIFGEYSATIREAFLKKGHDALSCDLLPTEIDGPHYQGDGFDIINDGWDLMIAHPECTYLTISAEWAYQDIPMFKGQPKKIGKNTLIGQQRRVARTEALEFVKRLWDADIEKVAIENPVGVITKYLPEMGKPQYVHPHWFGDNASKKTGLWLKNLPPLIATNHISPRYVCCNEIIDIDKLGIHGCPYCCGEKTPLPRWENQTNSGQNKLPPSIDRWKLRSATYQGIADAMADQWGDL